ncbi:MAG TPA: DUF4239 domain-containing protein [Candidatus Polarisedimenticolia bacterium]|jgi:hypothetical protein|nr:DUF4239 domain-containing protein [Candidatus Polarisedimenticolia bacterium]
MQSLLGVFPFLIAGLFTTMLLCLEAGRRAGVRRLAREPEMSRLGLGPVEGAVFSLFGLLIAFTFQGAASRFDARRGLVAEEANAIGTAWLRLDLLPADRQPALRAAFRDYLDSRLETYRTAGLTETWGVEYTRSLALQNRIWADTVAGCPAPPDPCRLLLLPALNAMIDITTTRLVSTWQHPPGIVYAMLFLLSFGTSFLAGYATAGSRTHSWTHTILFAAITAIAIFVIVDMEYPRLGFIRVDAADRVLVDLRKSMD